MEAIILAGGSGTRLQSIVSDVPKPMAPIGSVPFLQYILDWLIKKGFVRVIISVGYKWKIIYDCFKDNYKSLKLVYSIEECALGTGGAIKQAITLTKSDNILIVNGDTYFDINTQEMTNFHFKNKLDISIALKPMTHFNRYGTVEVNKESRILKFTEKEPTEKGLINGGIYLLNKNITNYFPQSEKFSFEKNFLEIELINLKLGGFINDNYFIDIGIPEDYQKAQLELPKQIYGK